MENRTKQLIAIGASVGASCQECLRYHVDNAREHGTDEDDIREAYEIGKTVRKGSGVAYTKFAESFFGEALANKKEEKSPCGC